MTKARPCVSQTTASDSTFVSLLAARTEAIKHYRATNPELHDAEINARLVGYCSDQVGVTLTVLGWKVLKGLQQSLSFDPNQ